MENEMRLDATKNAPQSNERSGSIDHVADYASQSGSTLLPMLIVGIVMIVVGMAVVMIFF